MAKLSKPKNEKKKKKKSKKGPDAVAMKVSAPPKDNPFETIWSRRKFDILGKKRKGEERRVGLARSRAIEERKNTVLKGYLQSKKASVFVDKRIGEGNLALDEFGKAIMRSQREFKLKMKKKSKYNLSDGEEEEGFDIPTLSEFSGRDDFEDDLPPDDDDGGGSRAGASQAENDLGLSKQLNAHTLQISREPGQADGEGNRKKTKKEVMEEVILKSKFHKAERAKEKENNEHLTEELDKNFTALVQSEALLSLTEPNKMNALKALVNKNIPNYLTKEDTSSTAQRRGSSEQEKPDFYDKLVKEMVFDMRARPSDRTKTPEEIAQEKREQLERLEKERQERMLAAEHSSDEDDEGADEPSMQKPISISGDDLGDSFPVNEEIKKKGWVDEILERKDMDGDSEDPGSDEDESDGSDEDVSEGSAEDASEELGDEIDDCGRNLSLKDWEQSDDDNLGPDSEQEEDDEEENKGNQAKSKSKEVVETVNEEKTYPESKKINIDGNQASKQLDLPYIIEAPKTLEELNALLINCSNAEIIVVINRIRASNAIKLAAENRKKMQVFYGVLLQYYAVLANRKPLNFELLNMLVKPLIEMSMEVPYFAAICARHRIKQTRTQFVEMIKNPESSSWPSSKTLLLFRLWSMIFPCSDFRHPVMTPAILLVCEYLTRSPIMSGRDIAIGLFLCSLLLSVARQSQKFCPEPVVFLQTLLVAANNRKSVSHQGSEFYDLVELKALGSLLCMCDTVHEVMPLNFLMIMDLADDSSVFTSDNFRASLLVTVVETLRGYVELYGSLSSFPEIFLPVSKLLQELVEHENLPNTLRLEFKDVAEVINSKVDEHHILRQPLQMRKQKPVPIKQLTPNFEENFVKGRDYDPDRDRAEARKLAKILKRQTKGLASDLRKDANFLAEQKAKEKAELEEEMAEKYGKAKLFLQEQEHAFKSGQLGKGRKRRR